MGAYATMRRQSSSLHSVASLSSTSNRGPRKASKMKTMFRLATESAVRSAYG